MGLVKDYLVDVSIIVVLIEFWIEDVYWELRSVFLIFLSYSFFYIYCYIFFSMLIMGIW